MTWKPDPVVFEADLEAKPARLRALASALEADPWPVKTPPQQVVLAGLGSSRFAALAGAARLRAQGIHAVAEYAGASVAAPGGPGTLALGISASGGTPETVATLERHARTGSMTIALTEAGDGSPLAAAADALVGLAAGPEAGGVACRSFLHTVVRLMQLEAQLVGEPVGVLAGIAMRAADAIQDLLDRRPSWLPEVVTHLRSGSPFLIAPADRFANAAQGALMLREGPRVHATACESSDWPHIDVYLTTPLADRYRALLFAGSPADSEIRGWIDQRGSALVVVGEGSLSYSGVEDDRVQLLTEIVVPELAAAAIWRQV